MKIIKKTLAILLVLATLFSVSITSALNVSAAGSSMSNATSISFGTTYSDSLKNSREEDFYKFSISTSGCIRFRLTSYVNITYYHIYDANKNRVWDSDYQYCNSTTKELNIDKTIDLTSGTYYLCVGQYNGSGNYEFKLSFTSANEDFKETTGGINNTITTASSISTGATYYGQLAENDNIDFYKFTMLTSGNIRFRLTSYVNITYYHIYDANKNRVWDSDYQYCNSTTKELNIDETIALTSGTYYLCVAQYNGTGNYEFKLSFTSANEDFKETTGGTNNTITTASSISTGVTYYGQLAENDNIDFYKFTVSTSGSIRLRLTSYVNITYYHIYDANKNRVWDSGYQYCNSSTKELNIDKTIDLTSGTYYFCACKYNGGGNYNFSITAPGGGSSTTTTYKVAYNANGGSVSPSSTVVNAGSYTTLPTPSKSWKITYNANNGSGAPSAQTVSLTCKGWSTSSSATSASYSCGSSYKPTKAITLYAVWPTSVNVTLKSGTPTRSGYKFLGWSTSSSATSASYSSGESVSLKGNATLYAVWKKNDTTTTTYKVTYNANGGSVSPSSTVVNAGSYTTLPTPSKSWKITYNANNGSGAPSAQTVSLTCKGWSTSSSATSASYSCGSSYKPTKAITLYAVWPTSVNVTLKSGTPTRSGYKFLGWSTSSSATSASYSPGESVSLKGNATLYAVWKKVETTSTPTFTLSSTSVSVGKNTSKNVTLSVTWNGFGGKIKSRYEIDDKTICSCEWLGWDSNKNTLKITGLKPGTTKVKVIIFDSSSQTIYDTEYITVKVTGPTVSLSDSNVTITTDEYVDVRVYCPKNGASVRRSVRFTVNDESIATAEWLGWEDEYNTIRIYGVSKGDTTVKISLKDYNTGEVYDTDEISVRVKNPGESTEYGIFEWIIIIVFFGWLWYV